MHIIVLEIWVGPSTPIAEGSWFWNQHRHVRPSSMRTFVRPTVASADVIDGDREKPLP